ncbi:unnamed protein product [Lactuca saligna]|uniref:Uncharacterized protein n=1 Tax=Lactuca saligna TaxID=75948 RepID=A0AA35VS97_LACSI|nr:unnamed protein product [Lactuca saligna]
MMTQTVPVSQEVRCQVSSGGSSGTGTTSNLRDSIPKLFASFKSQNLALSFVVILMAVIILLMHIRIVVLLLRPQTVQVVSNTSWMSNINTRIDMRGGTVNLLNKQIDRLKEETIIVETLLQKMRHEQDMCTQPIIPIQSPCTRERNYTKKRGSLNPEMPLEWKI